MAAQRTLSTAEERRTDIIAAATHAFARGGYWGTNTTEIAHAAGISQAYLYRLFANKEELFVAVIDEVHSRLQAEILRALDGVRAGEELPALLASAADGGPADRDAAMVLLHAAAASTIEPIGAAVRQCYVDQARFLSERGISDADIRAYFAWSQFSNTLGAAGVVPGSADGYLRRLLPG